MNVGDELKLPNGGNVYRIDKLEGRRMLLTCVWFTLYHAHIFEIIPLEN